MAGDLLIFMLGILINVSRKSKNTGFEKQHYVLR
jgi:hypothetical protein